MAESDCAFKSSKIIKCLLHLWLLLTLFTTAVLSTAAAAGGINEPASTVSAMAYNFSSVFTPERPLRVLVPRKQGFDEFVSGDNNFTLDGFSVQVFKQALQRLPFPPAYKFHLVVDPVDPSQNPSYNQMIQMIVDGSADAIAADLTITRDRIEQVDFTMPYIPSSLVMVTGYSYGSAGTLWDFLKPFSWKLWAALLSTFAATGAALYLLEDENPDFFMSSGGAAADPRNCLRRILNVYWFTSLCIFPAMQESVRTRSGRIVTIAWLCTMLIFNSSYTASLASLLSAQASYPTIASFQALKDSNVTVGYQSGSFLQSMLENLGFSLDRLKSYNSVEEYADALSNGSVAALLDEQPYTQIFLKSTCGFMAVDDQIRYFGGFGFAFRKNLTLVDALSGGILALAEDGVLQRLKAGWLGEDNDNQYCASSEYSHMRLRSFGGLFAIMASIYLFCILWRLNSKFFIKKEPLVISKDVKHQSGSSTFDDVGIGEF